jgi:hypothetical protein
VERKQSVPGAAVDGNRTAGPHPGAGSRTRGHNADAVNPSFCFREPPAMRRPSGRSGAFAHGCVHRCHPYAVHRA